MLNVQIVLFDGFDLLDAIAPYEVFCAAAMYAGEQVHVELATAEGARSVASGVNGLRIDASRKLDPELGGILLVPGASGELEGDGPKSIPSILARAAGTDLTPLVSRAMERQDMLVATVCGGSLLLAMGGLLEGRPAVTHHMGMDVLGATGAVPVQARVVDDGDFVSGGGVTSGLDVALYVVERELGPRIAHAVERLFEYERRGTAWRAAGLAPATLKAPVSETPSEEASVAAEQLESAISGATSADAWLGRGLATTAESFEGIWDATIATPVGKLQVRLAIVSRDGKISGTATQGEETVELLAPALRGDTLAWSLKVTKPMRLNLKFEVGVDGDAMYGTAKAGILPASKLTGKRIGERLP